MARMSKERAYAALLPEIDGYPSLRASIPDQRHKQHDWVPVSLRLPFLLMFALIFAMCIASIEVLIHHSNVPPERNMTASTLTTNGLNVATSASDVSSMKIMTESLTSLKVTSLEGTSSPTSTPLPSPSIVPDIATTIVIVPTSQKHTSSSDQTSSPFDSSKTSATSLNTLMSTTLEVPPSFKPTFSGPALETLVPLPTIALSSSEEAVNGTYTSAYYFSALYVPPLIAVLVKALWDAVHAATGLIEPFQRMSTEQGATAGYSLLAQYLSGSLSRDVFHSLSNGNVAPLAGAISYLLIQIGTPLASVSMTIRSADLCTVNGLTMRCDPRWVIDTLVLRVVEAILIACTLSIIVIGICARQRCSGIASDPSSLVSLAGLLNHEPLIRFIQQIDPDADHVSFKNALSQQSLKLGYHHTTEGLEKYGIWSLQSLDESNHGHRIEGSGNVCSATYKSKRSRSLRERFMPRTRELLFVSTLGFLVTLTLFVIVITFWADHKPDVFNKFFNSDTLWPKLLLLCLSTSLAVFMAYIERLVRIIEPFRRLAENDCDSTGKGSHNKTEFAPPETTVCMIRSGTAYSSLFRCALLLFSHESRGGRVVFQVLVSLAVVFADLNIIAASGIAFMEAMMLEQYRISSILSMALLGYILIIWIAILTWWRNVEVVKAVHSSKGAETIGGTMRYLVYGGHVVTQELARMGTGSESNRRHRKMGQGWQGNQACFRCSKLVDGTAAWHLTLVLEVDQKQSMLESQP